MFYLLLFEPGFEFTTDVARPIVRQQAGLVPYPGFGQADLSPKLGPLLR